MLIIKWKGIVQKNVSFDPPLKKLFIRLIENRCIKQHANWACNRLEEDYLSAYFENLKKSIPKGLNLHSLALIYPKKSTTY